MSRVGFFLLLFFSTLKTDAATFGTITPLVGGVVDIVLDEPRQRLYLVGVPDRIEVYSIPQRRFLTPIRTDSLPLSAALSRDGRFLYVACHNASAINVIDAEQLAVVNRVSLPARPEGIAVGGDNRVLLTTIGTGVNNSTNTLIIYDPNATSGQNIISLSVVPPPPAVPQLPPTAGRPVLANRSYLTTSADGRFIIGANLPNNTNRVVFVYEVASGIMLRSRVINNISSVLSVNATGSRFMAGLNLFETDSMAILGQQNLANAPYPIANNVNFNLQTNQGGSVFSPDGGTIYSAFNIAPTQNPPARPNVAQLQISDAENLGIRTALQLPENLSGKMVISSDGANIFAISESGFMTIQIGQMNRNPVAAPERTAVLLANDQCGVTENIRRQGVLIRNEGTGRLTATAQILTTTTGPGAPGGGPLPGGGVIVIPGGPTIPLPPGVTPPIGTPVGGAAPGNAAIIGASPTVQNQNTADGPLINFTYNSTNRNLGSTTPTNFLIQSPEAINIPSTVTVYQNNRDTESTGDIIPIETNASAPNFGLVDMVYDAARRRIYVANASLNRVEIFDERTRQLLPPISVGQLPRSMAMSLDGGLLYVASSQSSEVITIVDLERRRTIGRMKYPPIPLNANVAVIAPEAIAMTQRGLLVIMNNGTLWSSIGDELIPRQVSPIIGSNVIAGPVRSISATPNGEFALILSGNGFVYLYDALQDEFVQARQIFTGTQLSGYYGPVSAGPRGTYYIVNGTVLNQSLTPTSTATVTVPGLRPGEPAATTPLPVPAVAAIGNSQFARFAMPVRANANAVVTTLPNVELVNTDTGAVQRRVSTLEGVLSAVVGAARANVQGRTMVVDAQGSNAYVLTTSGMSVVSLNPPAVADRPVISPGGVVNVASFNTTVSPGGLVSIFGRSLAATETASTNPLPRGLGGVCVTLNNNPVPLLMTSPGQINFQIPNEIAAGTYPLVIRDYNKRAASNPVNLRVSRYAPVVLVNPETKQAAIFDDRGQAINRDNPTTRDRRLTIYALGLGPTRGGRVTTGVPSPASPLAETVDEVEVHFGNKLWSQSAVVVEWAGLVPGFISLYQINVYVPGDRMRGDDLDVTIRVGGVENSQIDAVKPTVSVR
jgi:uncharacterized protein (TIGR03437 family)